MIRSTAYELDPTAGPWVERHHVMTFDGAWQDALSERYRVQRGEYRSPVTLPIRQLNKLLRALAPGVTAIGRGAATTPTVPWIHGRGTVPEEIVVPLVATWVHGLLRATDLDGADTARILDLVEARQPRWQVLPVDFTERAESPGGTAEPSRALFTLLPEWIADRLASRPFRVRGVNLHFRVLNREQGTELVSWPPQRYAVGRRTWYYSARIGVSLHTVPFAHGWRVNITYGIRRWATGAAARPQGTNGATVWMDVPLPWPDTAARGARLIENSIGYDRARKQMAWRRNSPVGLLPDLDILRAYPQAEDVLTASEEWIDGRGGIAAGIVHSTTMGIHKVGPGLMPVERAELDAWVEDGLRPMLCRVADLRRVTRHNKPCLVPKTTAALSEAKRAEAEALRLRRRREALAAALAGRPLRVDIMWQSRETLDELLVVPCRELGLPKARATGEDEWEWRYGDLAIHVRAHPLGELGSPMATSRGKGVNQATALARAVRMRRDATVERLGTPPSTPGLAIVEIAGRERFPEPDSDPKHALRLGCADAGRLSQFILIREDVEASVSHRATSVWLDVWRQLGAATQPVPRIGRELPNDLQYVALWMVRHTMKGPTRCPARRLVALRVRPRDTTHPVCGWDEATEEWIPYPELLLALARDGAPQVAGTGVHDPEPNPFSAARRFDSDRSWQEHVQRRIGSLLYRLRDRPTLLMVDPGNLRQCWPNLNNGALIRDLIGFGDRPDQRLAAYGPDLRFVLVRDDNNRSEVPEWYAHGGAGEIGLAAGVWGTSEEDSRVFASTADKPHTATQPKALRKLVVLPEARNAPSKSAWNPTYLELTVLGCLSEKVLAESGRTDVSPDDPVDWATLTHQLRYHDDYPPLARPLPLHLARLAAEYVLPLASKRTADEPLLDTH